MNKQPEVTARTRQKLIDAFWELFEKNSLNQITVAAIAKTAGYNRSTFYEYFVDISDLLKQEEEKLMEEMKEKFFAIDITNIKDADSWNDDTFQTMFHLINDRMFLLFGPNGDPSFLGRMQKELLPLLNTSFGSAAVPPHLDYITVYAYSAVIGMLQYWHDRQEDLSIDEIRILGHSLIRRGVVGTIVEQIQENQ